jgi:RimJ/RimL family protein N-acetyltransferase
MSLRIDPSQSGRRSSTIVTGAGLLSAKVTLCSGFLYCPRYPRNWLVVGDAGCFAGAVTDVRTSRLQLHPIDVAEGERIVARHPGPADVWADDFPFDGDAGAVGGFLRATATDGEQRPFGYYRITRLADGRAVGGVGFKGRPAGGCVEIGYGLVPSARGQGYAAEAVAALLALAAGYGLSRVIANTTSDNAASQRTLIRAGFRLVSTDTELQHYEAILDAGHRPA